LTSATLSDSVTSVGTEAFPRGVFILNLFKIDGTSVSTILDSFTPQELKAAYRAKNACPS